MKNYFEKELQDKRLSCPCGCGAKVSDELLEKLNKLRNLYGKPVYIVQGATCKDYSVNHVGRKPTSTHISTEEENAVGVDISSKTFDSKEDYFKFIACAVQVGFTGFGQGSKWVGAGSDTRLHLDIKRSNAGDFRSWCYGC